MSFSAPSAVSMSSPLRRQKVSTGPKRSTRLVSNKKMLTSTRLRKVQVRRKSSEQQEANLRKQKIVQKQQVRTGLSILPGEFKLGKIGMNFALKESVEDPDPFQSLQLNSNVADSKVAEQIEGVTREMVDALGLCEQIGKQKSREWVTGELGPGCVNKLFDVSSEFTDGAKRIGHEVLKDLFDCKDNVTKLFSLVENLCQCFTDSKSAPSKSEDPDASSEHATYKLLSKLFIVLWRFCIVSPQFALVSLDFNLDALAMGIIRAQLNEVVRKYPQFLEKDEEKLVSPVRKGDLKVEEMEELTNVAEFIQVCTWLLGCFESEELKKLKEQRSNEDQDASFIAQNVSNFRKLLERLNLLSGDKTQPKNENADKQGASIRERLLETGMFTILEAANSFFINAATCVRTRAATKPGSQVPALRNLCSAVNRLNLATAWCICSFSGEDVTEDQFLFYSHCFSTISRIMRYIKSDLAVTGDHGNILKFSVWALSNLTHAGVDRVGIFLAHDLLEPTIQFAMHKDFYIRWRAVRTIANLSTANEEQTLKIMQSGVVELLKDTVCDASYSDLRLLSTYMNPDQFELLCQFKSETLQALANFTTINSNYVEMVVFNDAKYTTDFVERLMEFALLSLNQKDCDIKVSTAMFQMAIAARLVLMNAVDCGSDFQILKLIRAGILDVLVRIVEEKVVYRSSAPDEKVYFTFKSILLKCHAAQFDAEHLFGLEDGQALQKEKISTSPKKETVNVASFVMHKNDYWKVLESKLAEMTDYEDRSLIGAILRYK